MTKSHSRNGVRLNYILVGVIVLATLALSPKSAKAVNPAEVDEAIDKGIEFLLACQQKDGSWETAPKAAAVFPFWGGQTATVVSAILQAGRNARNPPLLKAIDWLANEDLNGTYAVGMRSQVWDQIKYMKILNKQAIAARNHDKDFLLFSRIQSGGNRGFYGATYGVPLPGGAPGFAPINPNGPPPQAPFDRFNSQFAVFGASEIEHAGEEVPTSYWLEEDAAWKKSQGADGGWDSGVAGQNGSVFAMTCAGLSSLFISQDYVLRTNFHQFDRCDGGMTNRHIEKGLMWLDKNIQQVFVGNESLYALYEIERVGMASGRKYFGNIDWYKTGAEFVVRTQLKNGSWGSIQDTCFAILFLTHGRTPLVMTKLQYDCPASRRNKGIQWEFRSLLSFPIPHFPNENPWNERPRDVANLAKWMGPHQLCGYLTWQTLSLAAPTEGMHDAPVLYISGSEPLDFGEADIAKLRTFVEEGGTILGNVNCSSKEFAASFMKLGKVLFPKYEFRRLPLSHPIFDEQYRAVKWKQIPELQALSNGVRELLIIAPNDDMGRAWQVEATKTRETYFQLVGNIFIYATGKENLLSRGEAYYIVRPHGPATREIKIARLQVGDNWDPEPGAWRRLSAVMHNERQIDIRTEPIPLGEGKLAAYKIAAFTGTTAFNFTTAQRQEIKEFVDNGGTLIIDSAGGGADFANSAEAELKLIFGPAAAKELQLPLPSTHPAFKEAKIDRIRFRSFARRLLEGNIHEPHLCAITDAAGRIGVFFSREDITAGLVGQQVDGIVGYSPEVATQLMKGIILYADGKR